MDTYPYLCSVNVFFPLSGRCSSIQNTHSPNALNGMVDTGLSPVIGTAELKYNHPMKKKLSLSTNKKSASEGEFIDVKWNCDACPDSLLLAIDSGYKCYTVPIADSGSTRIVMTRSKKKTTITLKALISGKRVSKSTSIRVRNSKQSRSSSADGAGRMKMRREKLYAKWCVFRAQMKYWWLSLKKWQKALYIALLVLWFAMLLLPWGSKPKSSVPSNQVQTPSSTVFVEQPQNHFI